MQKLHYAKIALCKNCNMQKLHYAKIALCKKLHFFQLKILIKPPQDHTSFADFNMFECDYCEKVFTLKSNLYRHVRKYHQDHRNIRARMRTWSRDA